MVSAKKLLGAKNRQAWVSVALLLTFLPFGLFGWSLHSLLPGDHHDHCGHFHHQSASNAQSPVVIHSHGSHGHHSHGHHSHEHGSHDHRSHGDRSHGDHSHGEHSHDHSINPSGVANQLAGVPQLAVVPQEQWSAADDDCQLCKVLQQLRLGQSRITALPTGEIAFSLSLLQRQNAFLASLNAYFLRGPPLV